MSRYIYFVEEYEPPETAFGTVTPEGHWAYLHTDHVGFYEDREGAIRDAQGRLSTKYSSYNLDIYRRPLRVVEGRQEAGGTPYHYSALWAGTADNPTGEQPHEPESWDGDLVVEWSDDGSESRARDRNYEYLIHQNGPRWDWKMTERTGPHHLEGKGASREDAKGEIEMEVLRRRVGA